MATDLSEQRGTASSRPQLVALAEFDVATAEPEVDELDELGGVSRPADSDAL